MWIGWGGFPPDCGCEVGKVGDDVDADDTAQERGWLWWLWWEGCLRAHVIIHALDRSPRRLAGHASRADQIRVTVTLNWHPKFLEIRTTDSKLCGLL